MSRKFLACRSDTRVLAKMQGGREKGNFISTLAVANLGEGPGGPGARPPPLFWVKKEEMTEGKMAGRASKSRPAPPPPSLAQGLDPPLLGYRRSV